MSLIIIQYSYTMWRNTVQLGVYSSIYTLQSIRPMYKNNVIACCPSVLFTVSIHAWHTSGLLILNRVSRLLVLFQVTWRKEDDAHPLTIGMFPFAPDTRVTVDYNQRTMEWMLIIQDVRPTDEGIYRCQISTKNDRQRHSYDIRLNVKK